MSAATAIGERNPDRERTIADALRAQWRLFERVTLNAAGGGEGFRATIHLNTTIVRGAAEQQGTSRSPDMQTAAEARRAQAIASCIERFNATLPPPERIRAFEVIAA